MSRALNPNEQSQVRTMIARTSVNALVDFLREFALEVATVAPRGSEVRNYWLDTANSFKDLNATLEKI